MFRTLARATNSSRALSSIARSSALRPATARGLISSTSQASVRTHLPKSQRYLFLTRNYSTTPVNSTTEASSAAEEEKPEEPEAPEDIPWLQLLESASKAPWLTSVPPDHQDRLRRSHSLVFHVVLYLGRPLTKEVKEAEAATQQFLMTFNSAPVSVDSEIGRARYAIALLTKTLANDIHTIPEASPIRTQHAQVFALTDALIPLCDEHLEGLKQGIPPMSGEVVEEGKWQDFWTKAQPVVLALGLELDKEGYGFDETKDREAAEKAAGGETKK